MQTSKHQATQPFIKGDTRPPIRFLRRVHYWIIATYSINGWISSDCGKMTDLWSWFELFRGSTVESHFRWGYTVGSHSWWRSSVESCSCQRSTVRSSHIKFGWRIEGHTEMGNDRSPCVQKKSHYLKKNFILSYYKRSLKKEQENARGTKGIQKRRNERVFPWHVLVTFFLIYLPSYP